MHDVPDALMDRLIHYFATYKMPRHGTPPVHIGAPYDRAHAEAVIVNVLSANVAEIVWAAVTLVNV